MEVTKNIYGGKDSGLQWANHLKQGLEDIGFEQSQIDPCMFFKQECVFIVYVDDAIMASFNKSVIDDVFNALKDKYCMKDEGDLTDYLGVNIEHLPDNKMKLTQPHLIDEILEDLNFLGNSGKPGTVKPRNTPAQSTKIIHQDAKGEPHSADWKYRSVIGKLNFLEKSSPPELAYAVHQAARFSEMPKKSHTEHVHCIGCFLLGMKTEEIILHPKDPIFECYADADFCGLWNKETATEDPSTARSRTGYLLTFAKCLIVWASNLQPEYSLSSTESENIALSTALYKVIP